MVQEAAQGALLEVTVGRVEVKMHGESPRVRRGELGDLGAVDDAARILIGVKQCDRALRGG